MDLSDVSMALRRHKLAALVTFVLVVVVGSVVAVFPTKQYKSSAKVLVAPVNAAAGDVAVVQFIVLALPSQVGSASFHSAVGATLTPRQANDQVTLSASADQTTGVVSITASSPAKQDVRAWTTAAVRQVPALAQSATSASFGRITILDPASPPTTSSPTLEVLLGSVVLGILLAVLVAVWMQRTQRRRAWSDRIRRRFGIAVLGELPYVRFHREALGPIRLFASRRQSSLDLLADAAESQHIAVRGALDEGSYRSVLVLGRQVGEGATTVASNLAWLMASPEDPVTALDANLRRPTLGRFLGELGDSPSLSRPEGLTAETGQTVRPGLCFVPAGIADRHPSLIIASEVPLLLAMVSDAGRRMVIDGPALDSSPESLTLATAADAVVLVFDGRRSGLEELGQTIAHLREHGATVLGVVICRSRRSHQSNRRPAMLRRPARHPTARISTSIPSAASLGPPSSGPPASRLSGSPRSRHRGGTRR